MNLTLNDFRAVLGKVNDGNVIMTQGEDNAPGIKKVNYGRLRRHDPTDDNAEQNRAVRTAFVNAISASPEGRRAGAAFISEIRKTLGVPNEDGQVSDQPLQRREIKAIIERLNLNSGLDIGLVSGEIKALQDAGVCDTKVAYDVRAALMPSMKTCLAFFADADSMMSAFGKHEGLAGFSHDQLKRFVTDNFAHIKLVAFDSFYWNQVEVNRFNRISAVTSRRP